MPGVRVWRVRLRHRCGPGHDRDRTCAPGSPLTPCDDDEGQFPEPLVRASRKDVRQPCARTARWLRRPLLLPHDKRVRICANEVVAGVCSRALLRNIRQVDARQFGCAHEFDQLEGLAVARSWGFESPSAFHSLTRSMREVVLRDSAVALRARPSGTSSLDDHAGDAERRIMTILLASLPVHQNRLHQPRDAATTSRP
jgi:hypothetical protein